MNTNVTNFRKDVYNMLDNIIKYNEPLNISTKNGNAIVLSEEEYNSLIETIYLYSVDGLKDEILERKKGKDKDFVDEKEVQW